MALPVPPAPTTRTRTARCRSRSGGRLCSMRILVPPSAHELRQRLRQLDQCLDRKRYAFAREVAPQSLEPSWVARQSAHIGVRESALVEAALPFRNRDSSCAVWETHRAHTDMAVFR